MARIATEYEGEPVKRKSVMNLLRNATTHPSATFLRRGEIPAWIDNKLWNELLPKRRKTALVLAGLYAPTEYVGDYLTNAENYPELAVMLAANKFIINPATKKFLQYASTKKWGSLGMKDAYKFYRTKWQVSRGGKEVPISKETFLDFIKNVRNPGH